MNKFLERIFVGEIEFQLTQAAGAIFEVNAQLTSDGEAAQIFASLDDLVDHAARVSLLLWPTQGDKHRGEHLRNLLGLPDDHVLCNKKLRNHLAHFDQRLDDWVREGAFAAYVDKNVSPRGAIVASGAKVMRNFDPDSKIYDFRGEEFDIQELATVVMQLLMSVRAIRALG